jgi:NAD(P)H-dependent FMN reductase
MEASCRILLVPGSLRARSTTSAVLRTAATLAVDGITAVPYEGLAALPHLNPDDDRPPLPAPVEALRAAIRAADALLFSTPEYAGALPGSFKNLLDWTIGDGSPGSIYGKPVGWVNASPRDAAGAHDELRRVLGYAGADIVERACAHVPVTPDAIDDRSLVTDEAPRQAIAGVLRALADHVAAAAADGSAGT